MKILLVILNLLLAGFGGFLALVMIVGYETIMYASGGQAIIQWLIIYGTLMTATCLISIISASRNLRLVLNLMLSCFSLVLLVHDILDDQPFYAFILPVMVSMLNFTSLLTNKQKETQQVDAGKADPISGQP